MQRDEGTLLKVLLFIFRLHDPYLTEWFVILVVMGVDLCDSDPCQNGGTCVTEECGFSCQCTDDYVGDTCETSRCFILQSGLEATVYICSTVQRKLLLPVTVN